MTIEAAEQPFPITWEDPADEQQPWFQDVMHCPLPISPLNATFYQRAFAEGASRAIARLSMPIVGLAVTVQNGYVYLSRIPFVAPPEAMEQRMAEMQRITMELCPTVLKDWRETFEPDMLRRIDKILSFDYGQASAQERARFLVALRDDAVDAWDIHMRVNVPVMSAVFGLEEMLTSVLGPEILGESRKALQGYENKSTETGRALWKLSRWVREDAALKSAVLGARVRAGAVEMDQTPATAEFQRRWHQFLETYGWRSDMFLEIGHKTWREEPSTPLIQLKGYIAAEDADDPFAVFARHAEERDRVAQEIEARLPEPARPQFRGMLMMAQQFLPISEDHNFTIDQKFTSMLRFAALRLGQALAADGTLGDPEDVFYLVFDEIREIAAGGKGGDLDARVRQRRRERARQATLQAPTMIGTPPSPDEPEDPLVTKFFGVGLVPSDDTNVITGHACSGGVVTGIAKVVPTLEDAGKLEAGEILVCRMTMPAWTPLFGVAGAVVADSGGPLSHCAIVAREYGIPCVAGTVNGTAVLRDGMRIRVDGDAGIVTVLSDKPRRG